VSKEEPDFTDNTSRGGDAIKRGLDSPPPTPEAPEINGRDDKLEARRDKAEELKLEARRDGVIDVALEARIERLESSGDMVEETKEPVRKAFSGSGGADIFDGVKVTPARTEKGWYAKSARAQRIALEKMMGTYRRHDGDPYVATRADGGKEYRIRRNGPLRDAADRSHDAAADTILITAADKAAPKPPVPPPPLPPDPVKGYCRECHKALPRYGIRPDSKFCSEAHSKAFRRRQADRDALDRAFKDYQHGRYADRMLSIHRAAAEAMRASAVRCEIKADFIATADGVMASSDTLPPIVADMFVQLVVNDGYVMRTPRVVVTADGAGALYTFEVSCPEGDASVAWIRFEGDPGWAPPPDEKWITAPPVNPAMTASYAARNHRVAEYMAARKKSARPG
jgi:hypothetical protein